MRRLFVFVTGLCVALTLIGCETVKGLGKDIEGASSTVQHSFRR